MKRSTPPRGDVSPPPLRRKIESTTTSKAVASFFKPASQKEPEKISWRAIENSLIIGRFDPQTIPPQAQKPPVKIAAFDLDDTLITATGSKWNRSATSWKWWDSSIPGKLKSLYDEGYLVAIFSNQGNISLRDNSKSLKKDMVSLTNLKDQVSTILRQLDLPISMYGATTQDRYRKPRIGMWQELIEDYNLEGEGKIDYTKSFYIGDAAGREKTDKRKKDFATSDRNLAINIGIAFQTPEEFFLGAETEPYEHAFEPAEFLTARETNVTTTSTTEPAFSKKHSQELIIFCGSPGAGKSTWYWTHLQPLGFARVNQDTLKSRDKCLKVARDYLAEGDSVCVDNTNADTQTREHWIKVARDFKIPIRLVRFTAPARLCEHNDSVRALNPSLMNPESRSLLPGIAFSSFKSRMQEPTLAEGFEDITVVDFDFQGTPEQRAIWSKHWVSKFST